MGERVKHHFIFSREQHVVLLAGEGERRDVSHNSSPCDPCTRNEFSGREEEELLRDPAGGVMLLDRGQALMGKV